MSRGKKQFLFILLIPFIIALGHDIYLSYFSTSEKIAEITALQIKPDNFQISDAGWVGQNYAPTFMEVMRDTIGAETWTSAITPLLQQPTILVSLLPLAIGLILMALAFLLGVWPYRRVRAKKYEQAEDKSVFRHAKSNAVKFTKK